MYEHIHVCVTKFDPTRRAPAGSTYTALFGIQIDATQNKTQRIPIPI